MTMDIEQTYQEGFQLRCNGQYGHAQLLLQAVVAQDPKHWRARHQLALIAGFQGDFDGSLASLAQLLVEFPTNLDIRYDLAMTQMMLGMYEEACAHLQAILRVDPTHEKAIQQSAFC